MNNKKMLVVLAVILMLVFVSGCSSQEEVTPVEVSKEEFVLEKDMKVTDFTIDTLDHGQVSLSDYEGKIVILNFWATWCKFCDAEMPDLQRILEENDDVVVFAIDVQESKSKVREYIEGGGYEFVVGLDTKGILAQTFYISAYPTSYFINEEGILVGAIEGMMTYDQMNQVIPFIRDEYGQ